MCIRDRRGRVGEPALFLGTSSTRARADDHPLYVRGSAPWGVGRFALCMIILSWAARARGGRPALKRTCMITLSRPL
eukprot:1425662-Alexandrium_andersonii.AAC.1